MTWRAGMLADRAITQVRLRPWLADGHGLPMKAVSLPAAATSGRGCGSFTASSGRTAHRVHTQRRWANQRTPIQCQTSRQMDPVSKPVLQKRV